jgi:ABC-type dipeptide/oligopeptide/nickel transport system permease component
VVGGVVIGALAAGWFGPSHYVMDTGVLDALGEALGVAFALLGVAFALLVVASIIGAMASGRGHHR